MDRVRGAANAAADVKETKTETEMMAKTNERRSNEKYPKSHPEEKQRKMYGTIKIPLQIGPRQDEKSPTRPVNRPTGVGLLLRSDVIACKGGRRQEEKLLKSIAPNQTIADDETNW